MKVHEDPGGPWPAVQRCIGRFGHHREHSLPSLRAFAAGRPGAAFADLGGGRGALLHRSGPGTWTLLGGVLAPEAEREALLAALIRHLFEQLGARRLCLEADSPSGLMAAAPGVRQTMCDELVVPLIDVGSWRPEGMTGKRWRKLRYVRSSVRSGWAVGVHGPEGFSTRELDEVISRWAHHLRARGLKPHTARYRHLVSTRFEGMDVARVFTVDGRAHGFVAGWAVPGSASTYYSAVGVHDYPFPSFGAWMNLEEFLEVAAGGRFEVIDLGPTGPRLLPFKLQFLPTRLERCVDLAYQRVAAPRPVPAPATSLVSPAPPT